MNFENEGTAPATENERIDIGGNAPEEMPSLADFFEEPSGGAWPKGWYGATVIEGYATGSGKVWSTEDTQSRGGDSRNLRICFNVNGGAKLGTRNTFASLNYRPADFTAERLAAIKAAREQFKGERGAWPGHTDIQRSSLAIAQFAQLENALGFRIKLHPNGYTLPLTLVGQAMDVRFTIDEREFNSINAFGKAGSKARK